MIQISNLNPIRLRNQNDFLEQRDCFFQKWQNGDIINIQFLSDEIFTVSVIDAALGFQVLSIQVLEMETNLQNVDFKVYEISFNVNDIPNYGKFFFRITNADGSVFDSYIFDYQEYFENTILLQCRNTENDYNVIFETGIEYYLRVDGGVSAYSPRIDGDIYIDQKHNPTLLQSESFQLYTLQVGYNTGVPTWLADIVNELFSCDIKKVNNIYIERNEGSDWEPIRVDNYSLMAMTIEIMKKGSDVGMTTLKTKYALSDSGIFVTDNNNYILT